MIQDFSKFRLEDLFEKSDMKMENGNMGSESSKKLKCCRENICCGKIPLIFPQQMCDFDQVKIFGDEMCDIDCF